MNTRTRQWGSHLAPQLQKRPHARIRQRQYATLSVPTSGEDLHGFSLKQTKHVPELDATALHFEHDRTGAEYLHVAREDKNNVFSIGFKTNPPDTTGVPHILEHLTLCGSKKYPVRDPFFKMMPRSLSNFMNAMTYPDHTVYPFATTNTQDFKNLMSVYMDATLHPLLRELDFKQEGWRIGPEDVLAAQANPAQHQPIFKGVVYNEMKGAMSSADDLFLTRWRDHIFPAINNSGGDPQQMTNLTYDALKKFQAEHYHPSNSKLFTYGNIPVQEHLKELGHLLSEFERRSVDRDVKDVMKITKPTEITVKGPVDPLFPQDQQHKSSVTWIMGDTQNVLEAFSLSLISSVLLDGFSSPLYRNLVEIGWGASYTPNTGYDSSAKTGLFTVGLNGQKKVDAPRLLDGVTNTFRGVKRNGIERHKIEARLQQIELALKHKTAHYGMGLMSRLQDGWFNGIDPMKTVAPEETLSAFRHEFANPGYLEGLFQRYWLNERTLTFRMDPSEEFEQELVQEEAARLNAKVSEFFGGFESPVQAQKALAASEGELLEAQSTEEDLSSLPSVRVQDIPRQNERKEVRIASVSNTQVQWREAPTNGMTYFRGILTLKDLPDDLRVYLPLFSAAIHRLGTQSMSVEKLEDEIKARTGGISLGFHSSTSPNDLEEATEGISFSSYALDRNVEHMFDLVRKLITETNFDARDTSEKLAELIKGSASQGMNEIAEAGSRFARLFSEAGLSPQARLTEEIDGLTQTKLTMDLAGRGQSVGLSDVVDKLKAIQYFALSGGAPLRVAITCDASASSANEAALQKFLSQIPSGIQAPTSETQIAYPRNAKCFFPLPYQVYYSARSLKTVPFTHKDSAPLKILSQLLTHKHLHQEIREKGGAYGAGAYASGIRGIFGFSSYRDPNPLNSIRVMNEAGAWAANRQWTERDLEDAKLSFFQSYDAPESVNAEGMTKFLLGIDDAMEQEHRERLLDVTPALVNDVAQKYLVDGEHDSNITVLGKKQEWVNDANGWVEMPMSAGEAAKPAGQDDDEEGYVVL